MPEVQLLSPRYPVIWRNWTKTNVYQFLKGPHQLEAKCFRNYSTFIIRNLHGKKINKTSGQKAIQYTTLKQWLKQTIHSFMSLYMFGKILLKTKERQLELKILGLSRRDKWGLWYCLKFPCLYCIILLSIYMFPRM